MLQAENKVREAITDLDGRVEAEECALEQTVIGRAGIQKEADEISRQLDRSLRNGDSQQARILKKKLAVLKKLHKQQRGEEKARRARMESVSEDALAVRNNIGPLTENARDADSGGLANALFSVADRTEAQRTAEHAAYRPAASIRRIVRAASRVPAGDRGGFIRYAELRGLAAAAYALKTPFSGTRVACCNAYVFAVLRDGAETLIWQENRTDALCIQDHVTREPIAVDAASFGAKLRLDVMTDSVITPDELPEAVRNVLRRLNGDAKAYRIVEEGILDGAPLFIQGEVYVSDDAAAHVRRAFDRAHTPIVAARTQGELTRLRTRRLLFSTVFGAVIIILAIFILLSNF